MRFFTAILLTASLTPLSVVRPACGQESEPAKTGAEVESKSASFELSPEQAARISQLVTELESTDFATRQTAGTELLKLDADSLPTLNAALSKSTGEIQTRLRQIVGQLRLRLFDERVTEFRVQRKDARIEELVEFRRFIELAGDEPRSRDVFAELLRTERDLFAARLFSPDEVSSVLEVRSAEFSRQCHGRADEAFPIASGLALMLTGSNADLRLLRATSTNISDACDDPRFDELITNGAYATVIRAVASDWLQRPGIAADRPLKFCMQHKLSAGRGIAQRIIGAQSKRPDMAWSLLCLAVLNDPSDLPLVESVIEKSDSLWPPRGQQVTDPVSGRSVESTYTVQSRDVALAVALYLRGASPSDFGMQPESSELTVFTLESLGFNSDADRDAAIVKYREQFPATSLK